MSYSRWQVRPTKTQRPAASAFDRRLLVIRVFLALVFVALTARLFMLQVLSHDLYAALADDQHGILEQLYPERGLIYLSDPTAPGGVFPAAVNREMTTVWASPRDVIDAPLAARQLAPLLGVDEGRLLDRLSQPNDPYEILARAVPDGAVTAVRELDLVGIHFSGETRRFYPEGLDLGQITGFVGSDADGERVGRYGLEGYWQDELAGQSGILVGEGDPFGQLIGSVDSSLKPAEDGETLVLTIDRSVQYFVCAALRRAVEAYGADGGSVVVMNPETGAVTAMCNAPGFDANGYSSVADASRFNNAAIFTPYEPGSVFKPVVMAAAIDAGIVSPNTVFNDDGDMVIGTETIRNSDLKAHGPVTMTEVLAQSLNTGMVHLSLELGPKRFREYVRGFGFGAAAGIDLDTEAAGELSALDRSGKIWSATASFGQGITATPLQLAAAYSALANGGRLMRPHVVKEIRRGSDVRRTEPVVVRQAISRRAASLVAGMLVRVVEEGHGKRAGVPGYWVAGKTGTAQVAAADGHGYEQAAHIGSFAGFAPVDHPAFVMAIKIDRPRTVEWAEQSAAPLFGEIAEFLLKYMEIPPERNIERGGD
jgi:cell division protein FtsI/penicillin-binding protein 2